MLRYQNLDEPAMEKLASQLAKYLKGRPAVIGLIGPLGAGKTTFVKAFAKSLGVRRTSSPTFVITHEYQIKTGTLYHLDFYRLKDVKQLEPLGLAEILSGKNLVLIEWVDRFPEVARQCDLLISLKVKKNNKRDVRIQIPN